MILRRLTIVLCLLAPLPSTSFAAGCGTPFTLVPFRDMKGIRTRWETVVFKIPGESFNDFLKRKDERASIQPNLGNLYLEAWAKALTDIGANIGEINLEPDRFMSTVPFLSEAQIDAYWNAIMKPFMFRNGSDIEAIDTAREHFKKFEYTIEQRDDILLRFLAAFDELPNPPALQFFVHQREFFQSTATPAAREARITEFVTSFSRFINKAKTACLDHLLSGIRLGEHSNKVMSDFLPLLVDLATRINAATGDWLKTRNFLSNGGGHGAEYVGISGVTYPFFDNMSLQTENFAFGYKWMQFPESPTGPQNITRFMEAAICDPQTQRLCDSSSSTDWEIYLGVNLGFNELAAYINASNRPDYAQVSFVGDSSDTMFGLSTITNGVLGDKPALVALRKLFQQASQDAALTSRWIGKLVMLHSTTLEGDADPKTDSGFSIYLSYPDNNGDNPLIQTQTFEEWRDWFEPAPPESCP